MKTEADSGSSIGQPEAVSGTVRPGPKTNESRPWKFIMEYYFLQPNTKFDWPDFRKKALSKKGSTELRRKIIIKNIHSSTKAEFLELKTVCLHMNAVIKAHPNGLDDFQSLLSFFNDLRVYLQEYFVYERVKLKIAESKPCFVVLRVDVPKLAF